MNLEFRYDNTIIEFKVIYRKRKTMCIQITPIGKINVLVPRNITKDIILKSVKGKANWIIQKQSKIMEVNKNKINARSIEERLFMYLGKEYGLKLIIDENTKVPSVKLDEEYFIVKMNNKDEEKVKLSLEMWYREKTMKIVKERINHYSINFKDKVTDIKVKEQKRRWASCTYNNSILFNWRCSMAPVEVLDYIVVHEMCHIDHKNHSKEFWNRVESIMPNYKVRKEWLKSNGIKLDL